MRKITLPSLIVAFLVTIGYGFSKSVTLDDFSLEDNQPTFTSKASITNYVSFNPDDRRIAVAVCQDITVYLDGTGSASIVPADIDNGSVGDGFSLDISSFSCSDIGTPVTVTLTVTNSLTGLSDTCTSQVTVLDTVIPTITLNGPNPQTIEACSTYSELGANANDNCSGIGSLVIDASAVNTSVVGSYSVTYNVDDAAGNSAVQVTRTVNVVDTTIPTITLNGSATVTVEACGTYNELGATASDGCLAIGAVVIDNSSVDETTVGSYTVTYNVDDAAGNSAVQVTRTVNVVDTTIPTITLNGSATVTVEACGTYNELGATAADGCLAIGAVVIDNSSVDETTVGSYTVTYNVDDAAGNSAVQVTRTVNVVDTTIPTITLNGSATVTVEACGTYNELGATASDGCLAIGAVVIDNSSVDETTVGSYTVTYNVNDAAGNSAVQVTRTVNVVDTTIPTITLNGSATVTVEACGTYNELGATANDGCLAIGAVVIDNSSVDETTVGSYTVTYNVDDAAGNSAVQVTRTVNVVDTTIPTITLNGSATVTVEACGTYNELGATASDGCLAIGAVVIDNSSVDETTVGSYTVTYNVNDAAGNSAVQVTRTVNVVDTTIPTITLNGSATVTVEACGTYNELGATASDGCLAIGAVVIDNSSVDETTVGSYTVTYNVDDAAGNSAVQVTRTVNVVDTTIPTITLNGSATVTVEACGTYNELGATAADGCLAIGAVVIDNSSVDETTVGSYTVTYNVNDAAGNSAVQVTRTVNVVDTTIPTITLNGSATVTVEACGTYNELGATAADGCLAIGAVVIDNSSVDETTVGSYTVTYNVDDAAGNSAVQVTRTVNVVDTTIPTITLNGSATVTVEACGTYNELGATAADGCLAIGAVVIDNSSVDETTVGSYTVTYNVDDAAGNSAVQVTRTVNVVDTTIPTITLNGSATVTVEACGTYNELGATAADGCLAIGAVVIDNSSVDETTVGSYTVTYNVNDAAGNSAVQVTRTVNVVDTTIPTITLNGSATVTVEACGTYNELGATASDGCLAIGAVVIDNSSVDETTVGSYTVTYNVNDAAGNSAVQVTRTVNVVDTTDPNAICQNITVQLNASGNASISASDINNGSSDSCSTISLSASQTNFDCSDLGNNNITLTVTDAEGNTDTCIALVTVEDNVDPVIPTLSTITAQCSVTVPTPTTTDGCNGTITGTTSDPTTYNTQGSYTIAWTFDDGNGNSIIVNQTVVINDTVDPVANCQNITLPLNDATGTASITPLLINNGSTDNCNLSNLTYSLSQTTFDCTNIGPNIITFTVTDAGGNTDTCTATVTVTSPNINGGNAIGYLTNTETPADSDDIIEVTACPNEPQNAIITLSGYVGNIVRWEYSTNGGLNWTSVANTTTTYSFIDILQTTLVRAVIQIGACQAYSNLVYVAVVPPDVPPTIVGPSSFDNCIGDVITVTAESSYGVIPDFNEGGLFNQANPPGWDSDGLGHIPANADNGNETIWAETNGPKNFAGRCYDTTDNTKFAIAVGVAGGTYSPQTLLETPVFNTLGLTTATLDFEQAYYLNAGSWCKIELSVDGGATYNIELDPGAAYNYIGPSDTGFMNPYPGFTGQCRNVPGTLIDKPVSIDLQNYIGMVNLRIRFTFNGTTGSAWALDNIRIPQAPIDEVIEWTDEAGVVVTTGATTTITPITPGVQVYGVTSLINGCRSEGDEGTEFIDVSASLAYAGQDVDLTAGNECGETEIQLAAYDNTISALDNYNNGVWEPGAYIYPGQSYDHDNNPGTPDLIAPNHPLGTGKNGFWSATVVDDLGGCNPSYLFTDADSPNSKFIGEPGEYNLTWTVVVESESAPGANDAVTCSSSINVKIPQCQNVDFDGNDDHVVFDDNFDLTGNFSISAWVKPESISGDQTIISKRNPSSPNSGYELRLNDSGRLIFAYNNSTIHSGSRILTVNRWYHVAVTHEGSTYRLYIDGIQINTTTGAAPNTNNNDCLLGTVERASGKTNYYHGWMDELRIWNKALNVNQIRETMNQEIRDNAGAVSGEVIPLDVPGLNWNDLDGYYRMGENCGKLTPYAGSVSGKLKNINSQQTENAPIPYTSRVDGQQWATDNTWTHFQVWDAPNSVGIDNSTRIDWNIVRISHNIDSGNKDITVLGLISDNTNKELTIANSGSPQDETNTGQMLWVTHYLDLDGKIDLVGESQLIQKRYDANQVDESVFDNTSLGYIERDQQGTSNPFNYNYWSSPVAPNNAAADNSNSYSLSGVLRDGTTTVNNPMGRPINWIGGYTAAASNPAQVSTRWLYAYINNPAEDYYEWEFIGNSSSIPIGLGYTMKGSGNAGATQNYVYVGKPNNGTINTPIGATRQSLVGNPYPSAIDSREFILDNGPGGTNSITGTLYFWEHYTSNATHVTELYEGGYAALNFTGGVGAVQHPDLIISNNGTKIPERYIPVGQGFFVEAGSISSNVVFNNSQRIYETEAYTASSYEGSVFVRSNSNSESHRNEDLIQRIRLRFTSPEGGKRPLLLGFVSNGNATDGVDWAYDGKNNDESTDSDLSWMIEDNRYVIQGVGEFDVTKQYPLGLFLTSNGTIKIELTELENFESEIDVYIYDSLLGTYTQINDSEFEMAMDAGEYLDRFFVTFQSESLSVDEFQTDDTSELLVNYLNNSGEIYINVPSNVRVKQVFLIQILGRKVNSWEITNASAYLLASEIRIPVKGITDGTYIVKVITKDNQTINKKVVIKQ